VNGNPTFQHFHNAEDHHGGDDGNDSQRVQNHKRMTLHPRGQKLKNSSEEDHCKAKDGEVDGHSHKNLSNEEDLLLNHSKKHHGS
jgi:hypothetical protein